MSYKQHINYLNTHFKDGFDITKQEVNISNKLCYLCFLNSLNSMQYIIELVKGLYFSDENLMIFNGSISKVVKIENSGNYFFSGQCIVLYESKIYAIETRNYPNQTSNEASNEQSIRGSHDSFTENIILNIGLIRRRIRNEYLVAKLLKVGSSTTTDITLLYMKDRVNTNLLNSINNKLELMKNIDILYDRTLVDHLFTQSMNPYPKVRFCERPDLCSIHLLQGYIVLLIDNSFNAIILPTTFFELSKQIEEYTQGNSIAVAIRVTRLLAIVISLYLLPIFLLFNIDVAFSVVFDLGACVTLLFQVIIIELMIEWVRLSYIHTPNSLTGILGFLVIFLLGDSAIEFNLYSKIILLVVVLCNVCNFVTPNYELSLANKITRIYFSVCTVCFGIYGFVFSILTHFIVLARMNSFGVHYFYPIIPFHLDECKRILLGTIKHNKNK